MEFRARPSIEAGKPVDKQSWNGGGHGFEQREKRPEPEKFGKREVTVSSNRTNPLR
jgi:hypothetical protein